MYIYKYYNVLCIVCIFLVKIWLKMGGGLYIIYSNKSLLIFLSMFLDVAGVIL